MCLAQLGLSAAKMKRCGYMAGKTLNDRQSHTLGKFHKIEKF